MMNGRQLKIQNIYEEFRKEAGKKGAHFIIDFKLQAQEKHETISTMSCGGNTNACNPVVTNNIYMEYSATGTLVRRKP